MVHHSSKTDADDAWVERSDNDLGDAANQTEHERGFFETIRTQTTVVRRSLYAVFITLLVSFENQAAGMVLCLIYLWCYQVETAGRSYEELDELFIKGVSVKDFKKYVTDAQMTAQEAKGVEG